MTLQQIEPIPIIGLLADDVFFELYSLARANPDRVYPVVDGSCSPPLLAASSVPLYFTILG